MAVREKENPRGAHLNHLCIGCGVCAAICPKNRIALQFDTRLGIYQPDETLASCEIACGLCEQVCPFVPENLSTAELTKELFSEVAGVENDSVLGYYLSTRVGYAPANRLQSASGGLATWTLKALFDSSQIDHVVCVGPDRDSATLFSFRVCKSIDEVEQCSGSCYQPVELSEVLKYILKNDGRYAVTLLPCMAKALRLAMRVNPLLRRRVIYILGITCGQLKSRHFIDHLGEIFFGRKDFVAMKFRAKNSNQPAINYSFVFTYKKEKNRTDSSIVDEYVEKSICFNDGINTVWCNRWFAPEPCDYCDDVFAECADAVFMDAWLPEFQQDWQGTSLLVSRNKTIDALFEQGLAGGTVRCEEIAVARVLESQEGVIYQKRVMAACHYEAAEASSRLPAPRSTQQVTTAHRKIAFVRRNVRRSLQFGPAAFALKKVAWLTSKWGWRLAKLYSMVPGLAIKRRIQPPGQERSD